ncbi:MAG: hypothetical protein ABIO65_03930, partial [Nitrospiria bacterium]
MLRIRHLKVGVHVGLILTIAGIGLLTLHRPAMAESGFLAEGRAYEADRRYHQAIEAYRLAMA